MSSILTLAYMMLGTFSHLLFITIVNVNVLLTDEACARVTVTYIVTVLTESPLTVIGCNLQEVAETAVISPGGSKAKLRSPQKSTVYE